MVPPIPMMMTLPSPMSSVARLVMRLVVVSDSRTF